MTHRRLLTALGCTRLGRVIARARRETGLSLAELTVSANSDPFRLDTPANHANAAWFRDVVARQNPAVLHGEFLPGMPTKRLHLRGFHYPVVSLEIHKPNGDVYRNTDDDWRWLQEDASAAARWLGYVPFAAIADERNAKPQTTEAATEDSILIRLTSPARTCRRILAAASRPGPPPAFCGGRQAELISA